MLSRIGTTLTGARRSSLFALMVVPALVAIAASIFTLSAAPRVTAAGRAALTSCAGDCGGDGTVTVDEIITLVGIATGAAALSTCPVGDANDDGQITVDDIIIAVNNALSGCSGPTTPFERGQQALRAGNVRGANDAFAEALAANPTDDGANLYYTGTRLAVKLLDDPQLRGLRDHSGVVVAGDSSHICDLDVTLPDAAPAGAPRTGEIVDTMRAVLLPEVQAALANLDRIPADAVLQVDLSTLPTCLRPETDDSLVEVDRGDLLVAGAGLDALAGFLDLMSAYNLDVGLQQLLDGPPRAVVQANPQLLMLRSNANLAASREAFSRALGKFVQAIDAVRAETDDQSDDILVLDDDEIDDARKVRLLAGLLQQSLTGQVTLPFDVVTGEVVLMDIGLLAQERVNSSRLFSGQIATLRPFLPAFNAAGEFDSKRFGDPTFGGMAPDMTQDKIDNFLVGGPPCAPCESDADCDAFGVGKFRCGYCCSWCGSECTGEMMRCTDGYRECADGTFY